MNETQILVRKLQATPIGYLLRRTIPSGRVSYVGRRYWSLREEPFTPIISEAHVWKTATAAERRATWNTGIFVNTPGYSFQVVPVYTDPRVTGMQSIVA